MLLRILNIPHVHIATSKLKLEALFSVLNHGIMCTVIISSFLTRYSLVSYKVSAVFCGNIYSLLVSWYRFGYYYEKCQVCFESLALLPFKVECKIILKLSYIVGYITTVSSIFNLKSLRLTIIVKYFWKLYKNYDKNVSIFKLIWPQYFCCVLVMSVINYHIVFQFQICYKNWII